MVRYKRDIKKKYITPKEDDNVERFSFKINRNNHEIVATRNRYCDMFILTEEGKEKQRLIKAGLDKDSVAVYWTIYCPGKGTCKHVCGGIWTCDEGMI